MLRVGWKRWRVVRAGLGLATVSALFVSGPADADLVYGRVYDETGRALPGHTFNIEDSTQGVVKSGVTTDKDGGYSLFLPPGIYTVRSGSRAARIRSIPEPFRQDIHLR